MTKAVVSGQIHSWRVRDVLDKKIDSRPLSHQVSASERGIYHGTDFPVQIPGDHVLRILDTIAFAVSNIDNAIAYYRIILGEEPDININDKVVTFSVGDSLNVILMLGDDNNPHYCASILCTDFDTHVAAWRKWAGLVYMECLGPEWPTRFVVLSDLDQNKIIVMKTNSVQSPIPAS